MFLTKQIHTNSLRIAIILCCTFFISACSSEETDKQSLLKEAKPPHIGILLYEESDIYVSTVSQAIQENIGDNAILSIKTADYDQLIQNEQIDNLIAKNVDGLIINLVDSSSAAWVSEKTKKANIPVVFFNREPDIDILKDYDNTCFVGTLVEQAGTLQGDLIKKLWKAHPEYDKNNDGIFQYIMLQANPSNVDALARTEHSIKQATAEGVKLQQIGETLMCSWDKELATQAVLQTWPVIGDQIELIIANNDMMALGAIAALQEQGYNLPNKNSSFYIPVIGVDALSEAIEAIKQGTMAATVKQDAETMGKAVAQLMLNAVNAKPFLEGTTWQWDESGKAIRIPYTAFSVDNVQEADSAPQ